MYKAAESGPLDESSWGKNEKKKNKVRKCVFIENNNFAFSPHKGNQLECISLTDVQIYRAPDG